MYPATPDVCGKHFGQDGDGFVYAIGKRLKLDQFVEDAERAANRGDQLRLRKGQIVVVDSRQA